MNKEDLEFFIISPPKQWRRCRARIRNLISRGAVETQAIKVCLSSKGYWRLAKTYGSRMSAIFLADQSGRTKAYLKEQDLVSIRELWIAFHPPSFWWMNTVNHWMRTRTSGAVRAVGKTPGYPIK